MQSPDWSSTAIFLSWDDWGGFYDHVVPPAVDAERLRAAGAGDRDQPVREAGLHRPPDAQPDAYHKFIEDVFLGGQRLDPATDGRPDPRPDVRENSPHPRRPDRRLRLHPAAATADDPAGLPRHRPRARAGLLTDGRVPGIGPDSPRPTA